MITRKEVNRIIAVIREVHKTVVLLHEDVVLTFVYCWEIRHLIATLLGK